MYSTILFFIFIPLLAFLLVAINFIFAPHYPYKEKDSVFECGFHSFLGQNRTQFSISFFIFALLFLLFDLEIILLYPYAVSAYINDIYGLMIMLIFFIVLTLGFAFELGKKALNIESKQQYQIINDNKSNTLTNTKVILNLYNNKGLILTLQNIFYPTVRLKRSFFTNIPTIFKLFIKPFYSLHYFYFFLYFLFFFCSFLFNINFSS